MDNAADDIGCCYFFSDKLDNTVVDEYPCTHTNVTGELLEAYAAHFIVTEHILCSEGIGIAVVYFNGLVVYEFAQSYFRTFSVEKGSDRQIKFFSELFNYAETFFMSFVIAV